ncbi:MAG: hypothetical protein KGY78_02465 [Anaerolineae bacterium]|nr:hypothetical protein [Anaerolineae bacterium]
MRQAQLRLLTIIGIIMATPVLRPAAKAEAARRATRRPSSFWHALAPRNNQLSWHRQDKEIIV